MRPERDEGVTMRRIRLAAAAWAVPLGLLCGCGPGHDAPAVAEFLPPPSDASSPAEDRPPARTDAEKVREWIACIRSHGINARENDGLVTYGSPPTERQTVTIDRCQDKVFGTS
jgi:hypothetical protein